MTQDRVIHTAQNQSLNARISRIETSLVPESDEGESIEIINSIATEYGWRDRLSSQPS